MVKPATVLDRHCTICEVLLDAPNDPWTADCGGDCILCMADVGDPDCIASILNTLRNGRFNDCKFNREERAKADRRFLDFWVNSRGCLGDDD